MALMMQALSSGGELASPTTVKWDIAGNCARPWVRTLSARPPKHAVLGEIFAPSYGFVGKGTAVWRYIGIDKGTPHTLFLELSTRCRRCFECRRYRSRMWRQRALTEIQVAPRTWFCTFTLNPEYHNLMWYRAVIRDPAVEGQDGDAQFIARHREITAEITLYIKRLRKQFAGNLRYLFVAEKHESGLPHYHALIHETDLDRRLLKRMIKGQWHLGFSDAKLAAPEHATYVAKYLSKDAVARIRASRLYGSPLLGQTHEVRRENLTLPPITPQANGGSLMGSGVAKQ